MATLERRNDRFRLIFYLAGKRYTASLQTADDREANAIAGSVERTLMLLKQGVLDVPEGGDLVAFVLSGGKRSGKPKPPAVRTLGELRDRYLAAHELGAMEENSLDTVKMHLRHIVRTLGASFRLQTLESAHIQQHIDRRSRQKGIRKRLLSPTTLRKEITSVRACWNWGIAAGLVTTPFPANRTLKYPKADEKPPFQTREEIERQVARGGLSQAEIRELWDCLFLTLPQIAELLAHVKEHARQPFLYPMVVFAAHTGARRSELLRARIADVDLEGQTVLVREKKRVRGARSTRRVPLSPFLVSVLRDWLAEHPGGQHLFCQAAVVRSKSRRSGPAPVTRDEAHDHFHRTLAGSKWEVLRGWHIFRHSFCSNLAAAGVDQRLIDAWVGHTTEEMRKRYRHLIPDQERRVIQGVFGPAAEVKPASGTNGAARPAVGQARAEDVRP
jgi:integrase